VPWGPLRSDSRHGDACGWDTDRVSQPFPQQQPQPQNPYAQQAYPQGQLILNLRKPFGLWSSALISPVVKIDGYPADARWEQNSYPVPAGHRQIEVASNYLWQYGQATMGVDVTPGQAVEVHYSGPMMTMMSGKMGFSPQPRPGMLAFGLIISLPIVLILIFVFAAIVSAAGS
jgi:hypothetical protein